MRTLYREFTSQQAIDAQYDLQASVPDFSVYARHYVEASAWAREALDCALGIAFGPTVEEWLDVFPAAGPGAPVLVFIHGGYWRLLSAREASFVAVGPVGRGFTVVVTNYALCPKVRLPEITRQGRAALAWVHRNIARFNGDPQRVVVAGHSAGGQQAVRMLATDWAGDYGIEPTFLRGALAVSGLYDLRPLRWSFLQPVLQLDADTIATESPLLDLPPAAPTLAMAVGEHEPPEMHRQQADFATAWREAGLPLDASLTVAGRNHFDVIDELADPEGALCRTALRLAGS